MIINTPWWLWKQHGEKTSTQSVGWKCEAAAAVKDENKWGNKKWKWNFEKKSKKWKKCFRSSLLVREKAIKLHYGCLLSFFISRTVKSLILSHVMRLTLLENRHKSKQKSDVVFTTRVVNNNETMMCITEFLWEDIYFF